MLRKSSGLLIIMLLSILCQPLATTQAAPTFIDSRFTELWNQIDKPVEGQPVGRGYTWGPAVLGSQFVLTEAYDKGTRRVQYFDKARMEAPNFNLNPNAPDIVTTGLLVKELVTGNRQDGDAVFRQLEPSTVQVAGDDNRAGANSLAPTYASFKNVITFNANENTQPNQAGKMIGSRINRAGTVSEFAPPESRLLKGYDDVTKHNIADVFVDFGKARGLILSNGKLIEDSIFFDNPTYVLGRPVTEPYWSQAVVGGVEKNVMIQLFERRILTYTPANPAAFKVEMGNVGQHYFQWRYKGIGDLIEFPSEPMIFPNNFTQYLAAYQKAGAIPNGTANSYKADGEIAGAPLISPDQKTAVFATLEQGLVALNLPELTLRWKYPNPNFSLLLIYQDSAYALFNESIYAINLADGKLKWISAPIGDVQRPITDGVNIYFTTNQSFANNQTRGVVAAIRLSDGIEIWESRSFTGITYKDELSAPIFGPNFQIYFTTNGKIYVYSRAGREFGILGTPGEGQLSTSLTYDGNFMFFMVGETLHSINNSGGVEKSLNIPTELGQDRENVPETNQVLTVAANRLYFTVNSTEDFRVIGVAANNIKKVEFDFHVDSPILTKITVVDGYVYFGTFDGKIYQVEAANPTNRKILYTVGNGSEDTLPFDDALIVADGKVYVGGFYTQTFYMIK